MRSWFTGLLRFFKRATRPARTPRQQMKLRVTCILGAGATIPVGGPTVGSLTQDACLKLQTTRDPISGDWHEAPFLRDVAFRLNEFLAPAECNFEDMLHALETLDSYRSGWHRTTAPIFRPRPAAFLSPRDLRWFDQFALQNAKIDLVRAVAERVEDSVEAFRPDFEHRWFRSFWTRAFRCAEWDLATLNYDDLFERIAVDFEDGYDRRAANTPVPFKSERIWSASPLRILHLHGSILFGYPKEVQIDLWGAAFHDLWKFRDSKSARETWFNRSSNTSQANEEAIIGPIITGLRKPDKLTAQPYDEYHDVLCAAIRQSPRLLVIGYSFGDLYLNSILNRMPALHKQERRIVFVTRFGNPEHWHCDPNILSKGWLNRSMFEFLARAMGTTEPLGRSLTYKEVLISEDQCCRIYLNGTQPVLEDQGEEILDFLTS